MGILRGLTKAGKAAKEEAWAVKVAGIRAASDAAHAIEISRMPLPTGSRRVMPKPAPELDRLLEDVGVRAPGAAGPAVAKESTLRTAGRLINRELSVGRHAAPFDPDFATTMLGMSKPTENLLSYGAGAGRGGARDLRRLAVGPDAQRSHVIQNVARSMDARSSTVEASLDRVLGTSRGIGRPRLQGDDVKSFARSKGKQRKKVAQRAGKWKQGSTLTSATGLKRSLHEVGGMKVSVLGEMPDEAHWAHLITEMEAAGKAHSDVAADIAGVQVVNLPGYSTTKLGGVDELDTVYGTASRGGYIREGVIPKRGGGTEIGLRPASDRHIRMNNDVIAASESGPGNWTVGEKGDKLLGEVFTHEFGHQWDYTRGVSTWEGGKRGLSDLGQTSYGKAFGAPADVIDPQMNRGYLQKLADAGEDPTALDPRTRIHVGRQLNSRYATTNPAELTAESYAAARLGHPEAQAFVQTVNENAKKVKNKVMKGHRAQIGQRAEEGRSQVERGTGANKPRKVRGIEFGHGKVLKRDR